MRTIHSQEPDEGVIRFHVGTDIEKIMGDFWVIVNSHLRAPRSSASGYILEAGVPHEVRSTWPFDNARGKKTAVQNYSIKQYAVRCVRRRARWPAHWPELRLRLRNVLIP